MRQAFSFKVWTVLGVLCCAPLVLAEQPGPPTRVVQRVGVEQPGPPPRVVQRVGVEQPAQKAAEQKPAEQKPQSTTKFATSKDGTRIAYEVAGSGPALMLLHGAGQSRQEWHRFDHVKRLSPQFTVIAVDLRGNGESDKPTKVESYAIDRLIEDLLAVADGAGAQRFHLWGFAYGGIVGRSLAAKSDRVKSMVYLGVPFGAPATGAFRDAINGFRARWQPIITAHDAGKLDRATITPGDYEALTRGGIKLAVAWQSALRGIPAARARGRESADAVGGGDRRHRSDGRRQGARRKARGHESDADAHRRAEPLRDAAAPRSLVRQSGRVHQEERSRDFGQAVTLPPES